MKGILKRLEKYDKELVIKTNELGEHQYVV